MTDMVDAYVKHLQAELEQVKRERDLTHAQVAEVARYLDPEVCPDAWGLRDAVEKVIRERTAARAEVERVNAREAATTERLEAACESQLAISNDLYRRLAEAEAREARLRRAIILAIQTIQESDCPQWVEDSLEAALAGKEE